MVAEADRVAGVLLPVRQQVVVLEVPEDRTVDVGAGRPRAKRVERDLLRGDHVVEQPSHLAGRLADHHRALELGVDSPRPGRSSR